MLSFLTHKDKPARGWGFTWCSREAAGEVTLLELGVRVVPSPSSEDKQWRARQSSFLEAGTGERGRVERRGCSGSDKGGPVSWGLREDKASRREMWICCCASVDVTAQGWGWEDWSSCFPKKKGAPRLKLLPSGLVEWRRGLQEDETTLHFLPFFFFPEKNGAVAREEMHGGKVEGVSKNHRKHLKLWEVRFICLGETKLPLEEMAKQESKYGDKN